MARHAETHGRAIGHLEALRARDAQHCQHVRELRETVEASRAENARLADAVRVLQSRNDDLLAFVDHATAFYHDTYCTCRNFDQGRPCNQSSCRFAHCYYDERHLSYRSQGSRPSLVSRVHDYMDMRRLRRDRALETSHLRRATITAGSNATVMAGSNGLRSRIHVSRDACVSHLDVACSVCSTSRHRPLRDAGDVAGSVLS
jgi:hypothetical protein